MCFIDFLFCFKFDIVFIYFLLLIVSWFLVFGFFNWFFVIFVWFFCRVSFFGFVVFIFVIVLVRGGFKVMEVRVVLVRGGFKVMEGGVFGWLYFFGVRIFI